MELDLVGFTCFSLFMLGLVCFCLLECLGMVDLGKLDKGGFKRN